jgi:glyoxylase-like metal-dependent hydrolase (beta-lactamase superfamily II)
MARTVVLASLLAAGWLSLVSAGQAPAPGARTVKMQSLNVADNLYVLSGGGGNSLALITDAGVVLVDTKLAGWGAPMLDAIRGVTDAPVTTIINTHTHGDHTGGNPEFPTVVDIIAHSQTRTHMEKLAAFAGAGSRFLPNKTFSTTYSILGGIDRIDLHYFGAGHTNGDVVVAFPEKRVAHMGDLFPSKSAPIIDPANGGSGVAYPDTLASAAAALKGTTTIVTGHTPIPSGSPVRGMTTLRDLQEYAEFTRDFLTAVREAFKAGKTAEEAAAGLALPERYKAYGMDRAAANVRAIYDELKR